MPKIAVLSGLCLAALLMVSGAARAASFVVLNTNDSGQGSLRAAMLAANAASGIDSISFGAGGLGTITLASPLPALTDNITINGPGASQLTVSGNNQFRIFNVAGGAFLSLNDMTLRDGRATNNPNPDLPVGAALYVQNGATAAVGRVFFDNQPPPQAGAPSRISARSTSPKAPLPTTPRRRARGGAIHSVPGSTIRVFNSTFARNRAADSGGAIRADGTATFDSLTVVRNIADSDNNGSGRGDGLSIRANTTGAVLRNSIVRAQPPKQPRRPHRHQRL